MIRKFSPGKVMFSTKISLAKGIRWKTRAAHPLQKISRVPPPPPGIYPFSSGLPHWHWGIQKMSEDTGTTVLLHMNTRNKQSDHLCYQKYILFTECDHASLVYIYRYICNQLCIVWWHHINGLVQERRNSIASALELPLSCTNPPIWHCGGPKLFGCSVLLPADYITEFSYSMVKHSMITIHVWF